METQTINLAWQDELTFEAEVEGLKLMIDSQKSEAPLKGIPPKQLMLVALAGCTGMDVVSILGKMRVKVDKFNVRVDGTKADEVPNPYVKMHIVYEFWGEDLPFDKLEKAIELSQEKYCGVLAVYKQVMPVTYSILTHHLSEV